MRKLYVKALAAAELGVAPWTCEFNEFEKFDGTYLRAFHPVKGYSSEYKV